MSFQDEAVEPLAVESAEHFAQLVRRAAGRVAPGEKSAAEQPPRERSEQRRALPRELGN
jgi:hypothetical protein